jgi:hypothetical protein
MERVRRRPGVVWRDLPTSLMILEPDDTVIRLVGPGRLLWLLLDEPASMTELEAFFASMDDEAGDGAGELVAGVPDYVGRLGDLGLIEVGP